MRLMIWFFGQKPFFSVKVTGSSDLLSLFSLMKMEKASKDSVLVVIADASSFTTVCSLFEQFHIFLCFFSLSKLR